MDTETAKEKWLRVIQPRIKEFKDKARLICHGAKAPYDSGDDGKRAVKDALKQAVADVSDAYKLGLICRDDVREWNVHDLEYVETFRKKFPKVSLADQYHDKIYVEQFLVDMRKKADRGKYTASDREVTTLETLRDHGLRHEKHLHDADFESIRKAV